VNGATRTSEVQTGVELRGWARLQCRLSQKSVTVSTTMKFSCLGQWFPKFHHHGYLSLLLSPHGPQLVIILSAHQNCLYYPTILLLLRALQSMMNLGLFLWDGAVNPTPNPQPGGPGYAFLYGSSPLTSPAWETLPTATLPPAYLSGSYDHASLTTTSR
jgi:hypothetical protein